MESFDNPSELTNEGSDVMQEGQRRRIRIKQLQGESAWRGCTTLSPPHLPAAQINRKSRGPPVREMVQSKYMSIMWDLT